MEEHSAAPAAASAEGAKDYDSEQIEAAVKLQSLTRGALSREESKRAMMGTLVEDMLLAEQETTEEEMSDTSPADSSLSFENISLASEDFLRDEVQEYLEQKYESEDTTTSNNDDEPDRIILPSDRRDTWITHTPTGGERKKWSAAALHGSGHVKERARLYDSSSHLEIDNDGDDDDANSFVDTNEAAEPVTPTPGKSEMLGSSMNTFLSPSKFNSPGSGNRRRATLAISPDEMTGRTARRGSSAAIMEKVTMYQEFADQAKVAKESQPKPKTERRRKMKAGYDTDKNKQQEYDIDTCRTPTAGDLRRSFDSGALYKAASHLPKLKPLVYSENEGIQAKIAKLGIGKKQDNSDVPRTKERTVDFATHQYLMHDSARKIQALARGFLFRKRDQEATNKVLKWLHQHQEVEKVLTGDPDKYTEEERAHAVEELTKTIHLLLPDEYVHDSDSTTSGESGSFEDDSFLEESSESDVEEDERDEEDETTLELNKIQNMMDVIENGHEQSSSKLPVGSAMPKRGSIRSRQILMKASATKIQSVVRGHRARKSDCGAAVKAINWLKEYKLLDQLQAKKKENGGRDFNEDTFMLAIAAINDLQGQLHRSATKIQAIGRGYTVRKFDTKKMMSVVEWIRACRIQMEEAEVPGREQLEKTWVFLENPYRWIRETGKTVSDESKLPQSAAEEKMDIDELVSTWEYVKRMNSQVETDDQRDGEESKPGVEELAKLSKWLVENGFPYVPSMAKSHEANQDEFLLTEDQNFEDVLQLWDFLQSNGVNVDVFRGDAVEDDNSDGRYFIEYIDEDLSAVYTDPRPSIKALISYWNFTRKHEIETLLESRQTEESTPKMPENDSSRESLAEPAKPEDGSEATIPSADTKVSEEAPETVRSKRRKSAMNIDNVMSSLKWMKKKGVDLNKLKTRASIGSRMKKVDEVAKEDDSQPVSVSSSDMENTLSWLKDKKKSSSSNREDEMSSMLSWLNGKGFDPNSTNPKGPDAGPPTTTDMALALRWLNDGPGIQDGVSLEPGAGVEAQDDGEIAPSTSTERTQNPFKDILYSLSWLQKNGFDLDGAAKALEEVDTVHGSENDSAEAEASPSAEAMMLAFGAASDNGAKVEKALDENNSGPGSTANKELSHQDMKSALDWLTKRGICRTPKRVAPAPETKPEEGTEKVANKKSPDMHSEQGLEGQRMKSALDWLEQKGFDVKKKALEHQLAPPTAAEVAATIEVLQKQKGPGLDGKPSSQEMQEALNWMNLQGRAEETDKESNAKRLKKEKRKSKKRRKSRERRSTSVSSDSMQYALAFLQKAGIAKPDSRRSKGLEKTVNYMKEQMEIQRVSSMRSKPKNATEEVPEKEHSEDDVKVAAKQKSKPQREKGYEQSALEWLINQGDHLEDAPYFKKLDKMLPGKDSQTDEQRAREIAKAMKWVKKQGLMGTTKKEKVNETPPEKTKPPPEAPLDENDVPATPPAPPIAVRQKLKEKAEKRDASRSPKGKTDGPTVKDMIKKKKKGKSKDGHSSKKSKKSGDLSVKAMLSPKKSKKAEKASKKKSKKKDEHNPEKDYELAVLWLKSKDDNLEASRYFKKLDSMVPKSDGETIEDRARNLVKALNWVKRTSERNKVQEEKHEDSKKPSKKGSSSPKKESTKKKSKTKKADKEKINRTVIALKDLVKVQKSASKAENDTTSSKKKDKQKGTAAGSTKQSKAEPTPERDFENALKFIEVKQGGGDIMAVEDANYFKKLDNMLPKKEGQDPSDRAKEMVKMLAWLRKKGKV
eukprot:scaffold22680_cov107-Cylindrotheca_fusiformis.AAC.35